MLHAACFMDVGRGDHCSQLRFCMPVGGLQPTFDLPTLDQFVDSTVPLDSCTTSHHQLHAMPKPLLLCRSCNLCISFTLSMHCKGQGEGGMQTVLQACAVHF